jgi:hypothetical protein
MKATTFKFSLSAQGTPDDVRRKIDDQVRRAVRQHPDRDVLIDTLAERAREIIAPTPDGMDVSIDIEITERSGYSVATGKEGDQGEGAQ